MHWSRCGLCASGRRDRRGQRFAVHIPSGQSHGVRVVDVRDNGEPGSLLTDVVGRAQGVRADDLTQSIGIAPLSLERRVDLELGQRLAAHLSQLGLDLRTRIVGPEHHRRVHGVHVVLQRAAGLVGRRRLVGRPVTRAAPDSAAAGVGAGLVPAVGDQDVRPWGVLVPLLELCHGLVRKTGTCHLPSTLVGGFDARHAPVVDRVHEELGYVHGRALDPVPPLRAVRTRCQNVVRVDHHGEAGVTYVHTLGAWEVDHVEALVSLFLGLVLCGESTVRGARERLGTALLTLGGAFLTLLGRQAESRESEPEVATVLVLPLAVVVNNARCGHRRGGVVPARVAGALRGPGAECLELLSGVAVDHHAPGQSEVHRRVGDDVNRCRVLRLNIHPVGLERPGIPVVDDGGLVGGHVHTGQALLATGAGSWVRGFPGSLLVLDLLRST